MSNTKFLTLFLIALFSFTFIFSSSANAQRRDYLTDQEIELVRDSSEIDKRVEVLIKAIDRRLLVLSNDQTQTKQIKKDSEKWGELPTGTKPELLSDISQILQKAIDDIDDLASRKETNEKLLKNEADNDLDKNTKEILEANDKKFPNAIHNLADASRRFIPILQNFEENLTDDREKGAIYRSIESCNMIIEASAQVQKPETKKKKARDE